MWDMENILLTLEPALRDTVGVKGDRFLGREQTDPAQCRGAPGCPSLLGTSS